MAAIGASHWDLAEFSGSLDGLQCAQRHLIVVGGDPVDLLAGGQPVLHNGLALFTLPVARLFADDLDVRKLFFSDFLYSIRTANRGFIAPLAHPDDQIALAAHRFTEFVHVHDPGCDGVRTTIHDTLWQV